MGSLAATVAAPCEHDGRHQKHRRGAAKSGAESALHGLRAYGSGLTETRHRAPLDRRHWGLTPVK